MPGHSSAALLAYPELSCTGGPFKTDLPAGIFNGVYCAGNDDAFAFLENVLTEIFSLFPGKYVHIGGDEVPTKNWHNCVKCQARKQQKRLKSDSELQGYFIRRMAGFVSKHQRIPIGWSEIVKDKLAEQSVVMDWIGGTVEAVETGHDVVRTPVEFCYFDQYQTEDRANEPRDTGGELFCPWKWSMASSPCLRNSKRRTGSAFLGPQANVWTSICLHSNKWSIRHSRDRRPRRSRLVRAWSCAKRKDFAWRERRQEKFLRQLSVNYRPPCGE